MDSTSRSCLHSGPGGFYLHVYHRLRDVFFCQVDWTKRESAGRLEVIGSECLIGCIGGVITLVSCPCLSVELNGRSVLVYRIMRMVMKSITTTVAIFREVPREEFEKGLSHCSQSAKLQI
jgi:hypothetical protein